MAAGEWALRPHPAIPRITPAAPLAVVVLDGWGEARADAYNAIAQAGAARRPPRPRPWCWGRAGLGIWTGTSIEG